MYFEEMMKLRYKAHSWRWVYLERSLNYAQSCFWLLFIAQARVEATTG